MALFASASERVARWSRASGRSRAILAIIVNNSKSVESLFIGGVAKVFMGERKQLAPRDAVF